MKIEEASNWEEAAKVNCNISCGIAVPHKLLEHDWCCQICGGSHSERICQIGSSDEIPILNIHHRDKKLVDLQIQNFLRSFFTKIHKEEGIQRK